MIHEYQTNNDLILNNKKGNTKAMLFGTATKLAKPDTRYKYLGTKVDQCAYLNDQFERIYKKMLSRLRLLSKLRTNLTTKAGYGLSNDDCSVIPI